MNKMSNAGFRTLRILFFVMFFLPVCGAASFSYGQEGPSLPGEGEEDFGDPLLPGEEGTDGDGPGFLPSGDLESFSFDTDKDFAFEKTPEQLEQEARQEAFDAALQGLLPLRPSEIRRLLEHFDRTRESVETPVYPAPRPEVSVQTVSLDPGSEPVTIKLAFGRITTVSFLDVTGAPWPIQDLSWAGNFSVSDLGDMGDDEGGVTNKFRISPEGEFAIGNMSLTLLGLQTPVIVQLETSRDVVHYRFDAIIPDYGPLAQTPLIDTGINITAGGGQMSAILEGVIPGSAKKLDVTGVDGRTTAYRDNGTTFIRTPLTLLSPAWSGSASSADGMNVYAIDHTPVILLSDKGRMVRARLSIREGILDE